MPAPSIAKIFGPTIIGNSSSEPDPKSAILELRRQHGVRDNAVESCTACLRFIDET